MDAASDYLGPNHKKGCDGWDRRYSGEGCNRLIVCPCGAEDHAPEPGSFNWDRIAGESIKRRKQTEDTTDAR